MTATKRHPCGIEALETFVAAGVLDASDLHVAAAIGRTIAGTSDAVLLAAALCVRGLRYGHVCIEVARVASTVLLDLDTGRSSQSEPGDSDDPPPDVSRLAEELPWPDRNTWIRELASSPAVAECDAVDATPTSGEVGGRIRPLVFDGTRVYLERYWRYERQVGDALLAASGDRSIGVLSKFDAAAVESALDTYLGHERNQQRSAARAVFDRRVTLLAGGPGTGKTHTIAHLLATVQQLATEIGETPEIALAAPTGKAAARMTEAIRTAVTRADPPESVSQPLLRLEATTIHRLLGYRDGITFRHDADDPLPHDLVIIDETSMVALPLMARLLDALRRDANVVLVGDPFQLASVEAGAVLGDVVGPAARSSAEPDDSVTLAGPMADSIVVLDRVHRYGDDSGIATLAQAVRAGDDDAAIAVLTDPSVTDVEWVEPTDATAVEHLRGLVVQDAAQVMSEARSSDAGASLNRATALKVLCGTRFGPLGSFAWSDLIEARVPTIDPALSTRGRWYIGRPLMITRNDYITGVFNGDTALVVERDGHPMLVVEGTGGSRLLSTSQLDSLETWWAMTIHKSQGSEFGHAVVSLPDPSSRVLTNELLYTAITRGRDRVTIVAREESLRTAVGRRISRASGLGARLWP